MDVVHVRTMVKIKRPSLPQVVKPSSFVVFAGGRQQRQQQRRSGQLRQPAGSPLGVGGGPDAETEAGGERLVRPGSAAVQLAATVRLTSVRVCSCD